MKLNYTQTAFIKPQNIILRKNIFIKKKTHIPDPKIYFKIIYTDIFDCVILEQKYTETFSFLYQQFLEDTTKGEEQLPLEAFSTKQHPLGKGTF